MNARRHTAYDAAMDTLERLRAAGHVALFAGGCVRDRLMNRTPKDYDVVTDALPARVQELFRRSRHVGAKFGVTLVRRYGFDIEVATFRADGPYSDGRRPDEVRFGDAIEDARRRDFTVNGLFYDPSADQIIDHVGGLADLKAGILRTIGDPDLRFAEDHLRLLRAVRFAARLGFAVAPATLEAMTRLAPRLETISPERVWQELEQILTGPTRSVGWSLLVRTKLRDHLSSVWPRVADEDERIRRRLDALPHRPIASALALAAVLPGRTPQQGAKIGRALRLSNRLTRCVAWLLGSLRMLRNESTIELADLKRCMAGGPWQDLLELLRVDLVDGALPIEPYERIRRRAEAIAPEDVAPPPLLTGADLTAMGVTPGPGFGDVLQAVYRAQLNEQLSTTAAARELARSLLDAGV